MNTPKLIDKNGVFTIEYRSRYLYSKINPLKIEKVASSLELKENTLYIFPSPLLFYGTSILEEKLPDSSKIIYIEVENELYLLNRSSKLIFIKSGFDFLKIINNINFSQIRYCELLPLTGGYSLNKAIFDRLHKITLNVIQNYWHNRITQINLGQLWLKNLIRNSRNYTNHQPLSSLTINNPIVVVGAGESLESQLEFLKNNRSKIYILCVDTALEALLQGGVIPHGVIALEAQFYNLPDFFGAKNLEIDLIYDMTSYPGVLRVLKGNKYFTLTKYEDNDLIKRFENNFPESTIPPMGSVGITALYIALRLTKMNVFICGLDFSYKMDKSHSRGTPYHITSLLSRSRVKNLSNYQNTIKRPLLIRENKEGILELTDKILLDYALRTEELLLGNNRVYDITNRGLKVTSNMVNTDDIEFSPYIHISKVETTTSISSEFTNSIESDLQVMTGSFIDYFNKEISINDLIKEIDKKYYLFSYIPYCNMVTKENVDKIYYAFLRLKKRAGIS